MKRSKFTDSQIMDALKRVDAGLAVPDVCRELGISTATFYKWRAKYGGMDTSMMARMKERTGPANLNTPISEFSAILIGPMGQKVERVNGRTTKTYPLSQVKGQSGASSHCWG